MLVSTCFQSSQYGGDLPKHDFQVPLSLDHCPKAVLPVRISFFKKTSKLNRSPLSRWSEVKVQPRETHRRGWGCLDFLSPVTGSTAFCVLVLRPAF